MLVVGVGGEPSSDCSDAGASLPCCESRFLFRVLYAVSRCLYGGMSLGLPGGNAIGGIDVTLMACLLAMLACLLMACWLAVPFTTCLLPGVLRPCHTFAALSAGLPADLLMPQAGLLPALWPLSPPWRLPALAVLAACYPAAQTPGS